MSANTAKVRVYSRIDSPSSAANSPQKHAARKKILKLTKMISDQPKKLRVRSVETERRDEPAANS